MALLTACVEALPPDKIDPSGNLARRDYLALRERTNVKSHPPKADMDELDDDDLCDVCDEDDELDRPTKPVRPAKTRAAKGQDAAPPIPEMPSTAAAPALPQHKAQTKLVSLTVNDSVPLRDVLIELGREGGVNLEMDPRITGGVIFSAHDQPFTEVLQHLCALAGLRYRENGAYLRVELDEPYQQIYPVDYLSLARRTTSEVGIATNVFDVDVGASGSGSRASSTTTDNNSTSKITASGDADFWAELEKSLTQLLAATYRDKALVGGLAREAADKPSPPSLGRFTLDRQAGIVTVFGTERQQETVRTYLERLQRKASAQVLIEARIVEVELDDAFKSGINWRTLFDGASNAAMRFGTVGAGAPFASATTAADGLFTASLKGKDFAGILSLVRTFGTTRVLSSPRLTVLNNQTAVLKVARNEVYFVTNAQYSTSVSTSGVVVSGTPVFTSTPRTVPVGLVMTVQPAIDGERGRVTMTLRPTISRVVDRVNDPSIALNASQSGSSTTVESKIPVLAVREMDSVLQLRSGEVAIMGGLMQDSSINQDQGVPPFDTLPLIGSLAKSRDNSGATSELVIMLRATILDNPIPDAADKELYHHYSRDPRTFPLPNNP